MSTNKVVILVDKRKGICGSNNIRTTNDTNKCNVLVIILCNIPPSKVFDDTAHGANNAFFYMNWHMFCYSIVKFLHQESQGFSLSVLVSLTLRQAVYKLYLK